jgi:hypothetical protein
MGVITRSTDVDPARTLARPEGGADATPPGSRRRGPNRVAVVLMVIAVTAAVGGVIIEHRHQDPVVAAPTISASPSPSPSTSPLPTPTAPATRLADRLFAADYSVSSLSAVAHTGWRSEQEPRIAGTGPTQAGRIRIVTGSDVPGAGAAKPTGAMRVELKPYESTLGARDGDVTVTSGYAANRAEVYGRYPDTPATSTPPSDWPDPVGSERWYSFSLLVPVGFVFATDSNWIVITQWKGLRGGSPPIAIEIKRGALRLGGTRANSRLIPNDGNLGKIVPGQWTHLEIGLKFATDPAQGWVEVYRDGGHVIPRTTLATMDTTPTSNGRAPDPIYLKQGIYRARSWKTDAIVYFGPMVVTRTK